MEKGVPRKFAGHSMLCPYGENSEAKLAIETAKMGGGGWIDHTDERLRLRDMEAVFGAIDQALDIRAMFGEDQHGDQNRSEGHV
jgi:hypothetical protein